MLTTPPSRRAVQGFTFVVWALAVASAVYWGFRVAAGTSAAPAPSVASRGVPPPDPMAVARLLGSSPVPMAAVAPVVAIASRFSLVGIVSRRSRTGIALISVDGKPARPYRVGSTIDEGLVLQSVEGRRASIGPSAQGPASVTLELPVARPDAGPALPGMPPVISAPPMQPPGRSPLRTPAAPPPGRQP